MNYAHGHDLADRLSGRPGARTQQPRPAVVAVLLALISAVTYGCSDFAAGLATRRASVLRVTLISEAASVAVVGLALAVIGAHPPDLRAVVWGCVAGLGGVCGALALYVGFRHAAFSVVGPLSAVGAAGFSVLAGLLLGERPTVLALTGIVLALPAIVGVSASVGTGGGEHPGGGGVAAAGRGAGGAGGGGPTAVPGWCELRARRRSLLRAALRRPEPGRIRQRAVASVLRPGRSAGGDCLRRRVHRRPTAARGTRRLAGRGRGADRRPGHDSF